MRLERALEIGSKAELCIVYCEDRIAQDPATDMCHVAHHYLDLMTSGKFLFVLPAAQPAERRETYASMRDTLDL